MSVLPITPRPVSTRFATDNFSLKCISKFKILIELSLRGKNQWRSKGHLVVEVFLHAFNRALIYGEYLYATTM